MDGGAGGDEVEAKLAESGQGVDLNAAARLGTGAAVDQVDRSAQLADGKVVEKDNVGARFDYGGDLFKSINFDFDREVFAGVDGEGDSFG